MRTKKIGRNDPCPCQSGKKHKHCHGKFPGHEYVAIDLTSLNSSERWSLLAEEIQSIVGLPKNYGGQELKAAFRKEHVTPINEAYDQLIGQFSTRLAVPQARTTHLGALYLGDIQERRIRKNILRMSLYADEIYVVDPFISPIVSLGKAGSPYSDPDKFVLTTYQATYFLLRMRHWIGSGIVTVLPNPLFQLNSYRDYVYSKLDEVSAREEHRVQARSDLSREFKDLNFHADRFAGIRDERLEETIRALYGEGSSKGVSSLASYIRKQREIRYDLPHPDLFKNSNSQIMLHRSGLDAISAALVCSETNAFPFSEHQAQLSLVNSLFEKENAVSNQWQPIAQAFQRLEMSFLNDVSSDFAIGLRKDGRLQSFRLMLRRLWREIGAEETASPSAVLGFADQIAEEYEKARVEWDAIKLDAVKMGLGSAGVFAAGAFTLNLPTFITAGGALLGAYELWKKSRAFRVRNPASVLIDLKSNRDSD